jgi:hypothetical protein
LEFGAQSEVGYQDQSEVDTVTDAGAVTALEVVDRDLSSTVAALHSESARTARNIGAEAALKVCTSSRN